MSNDHTSPWRAIAIDMAVNNGGWDSHTYGFEAVENLLMGIICGLLDVADALRELDHRPDALAKLADAAPTAEALALLLRAQKDTTKENQS
jgi:hypothetical protein